MLTPVWQSRHSAGISLPQQRVALTLKTCLYRQSQIGCAVDQRLGADEHDSKLAARASPDGNGVAHLQETSFIELGTGLLPLPLLAPS